MSGNVFHFVLKKIFETVASLGVLAALTFFLLKALPGGPFDEELALHPLIKERLLEHWQVDQSWALQAVSYMGALARGDLGVSMMRPDRTVGQIISQGLLNTLLLNSLALVFILVSALFFSIMGVRYRGTWVENLIDQVVIAFLSLPSLFLGPLLIFFFGFYLSVLPVALLAGPQNYILPLLTLSLRPMASLVRILKNSMTENVAQDYVRTARAKGVGTWRILSHHVLKNSMIPFLSYGGPLVVSLLSGSFLVEILFVIPGLGTEFISALNDRDYTLIVGLTLFYGALLILVNSAIDILLRFVDPRLRGEA